MKLKSNTYSVSAVSYLNTKPLLYGLLGSPIANQIDLQLDIPSACAAKLESGQVDIGLVPVAVIPHLSAPHLVSDFCIGTNGSVKTVAIFSEKPIDQLDSIFLDFHSRTSVALTRFLLKEYWQLTPNLIPAKKGFIDQIEGRTGGLVIGDRTIGLEQRYPFVYDLGEAWMSHTGLPFVFAAWISNSPIDPDFLIAFNQALQSGIDKIPELMFILPPPHPDFNLQTYYTENISYQLDYPKRLALDQFLHAITDHVPQSMVDSLALQ
ncbi:MAG: menaquinone biosynthesis protein [Saprospiraceae bacterium]|nr:menaquinone biosynthesis protein [Saprospiraceae bacterium]